MRPGSWYTDDISVEALTLNDPITLVPITEHVVHGEGEAIAVSVRGEKKLG